MKGRIRRQGDGGDKEKAGKGKPQRTWFDQLTTLSKVEGQRTQRVRMEDRGYTKRQGDKKTGNKEKGRQRDDRQDERGWRMEGAVR
jgi:hypothetical protein